MISRINLFGIGEERRAEEKAPLGQRVRAAAEEPLKDLKESYTFWHRVGGMFVCLARPKRAISQFFTNCLRKGWEKAGVDSAMHATVAKGCNAVISLKKLSGKEAEWVTTKDVADWRVPAPLPRTLCRARRAAEQLGVPSLVAKGGKATIALTNGAYKKLYGEDLFPEIPSLSPEIAKVIFGISSNEDFCTRVEKYFLRAIQSNPIIEQNIQQGWASNYPLLNIPGFICQDVARFKTKLYEASRQACEETLLQTSTERRAFIQALEGVALSFIYKKIAAQMPGKEVLIRETVLYVIQNYFNFFSGCIITRFFPERLQNAIDSLPSKPLELAKTISNLDFIDSAGNTLGNFVESNLSSTVAAGGALVGLSSENAVIATMSLGSKGVGRVAKEVFSLGATKGLEYGPATAVVLYRLVYEELDKLASRGNQRMQDFSYMDLLWGNVGQPRPGAPVDPNADYVTPIAYEFVLGTLNRLCQGNGLLSLLYDVLGEATLSREPAAPSEPLPGVAELKTALGEFVTSLRAKLMANLGARVNAAVDEEYTRQTVNAAEVRTAIRTVENRIHRQNATAIASMLSPVVNVDPQTVYNVLTFNPLDYFTKGQGQ